MLLTIEPSPSSSALRFELSQGLSLEPGTLIGLGGLPVGSRGPTSLHTPALEFSYICAATPALFVCFIFPWVMDLQTQVLTLTQHTFYHPRHLPAPQNPFLTFLKHRAFLF